MDKFDKKISKIAEKIAKPNKKKSLVPNFIKREKKNVEKLKQEFFETLSAEQQDLFSDLLQRMDMVQTYESSEQFFIGFDKGYKSGEKRVFYKATK